MNNDYELNRHKKSDTVKWIVAFALIAVLLIGMTASLILAVNNGKDKQNDVPAREEEHVAVDGDGNAMESGEVYAMPTNMIFATAAAEQTDGITLQATITPETAENKTVDWNVSFVNPSSAWASGKTASDYVTATPTSDGALTATINCLKAFGEQIKITVVSRANEYAKADCVLDYARKISDALIRARFGSKGDYVLLSDYGSNEIVADMVIPNDVNEIFRYNTSSADGKPLYPDTKIWLGCSPTFFDFSDFPTLSEEMPQVPQEYYDRKEAENFKFSDYTIKDFSILGNDVSSETYVNVSLTDEFRPVFEEIVLGLDGSVSIQDLDWGKLNFSSNPFAIIFYFMMNNGLKPRPSQGNYFEIMGKVIQWVKANPAAAMFEFTWGIKGEYSTFEKTWSFRYNPATAIMPVFDVTLDRTEIVL